MGDGREPRAIELMFAHNNSTTGRWAMVENHGLLSSCLPTTIVPALIQRATGVDPLLVYKWYSIILLPLLPVVVFLLASRFINKRYAFWVGLFFMAQIYFLHAPAYARVNIALIFFGLALLVLYSSLSYKWKIPLLGVTATGITLSHYGTAFASLFIFGAVVLWLLGRWLCKKVRGNGLIPTAALFCFIGVSVGIWHAGVTYTPWVQARSFVVNTARVESPTEGASDRGLFDMSSREEVVQVAFGKTLPTMNPARRTEFAFSWLTILIMTYGLFVVVRSIRGKLGESLTALIVVCYCMILAGIALPHLSLWYGIARIYYMALVPLSLCFAIGAIDIAKRVKVPAELVLSAILIPYFLCTTGVIHTLMGFSR